ncbi:trypsin-like peptidase domain-containing protein [Candidatus Neptunochlamydia vexilliferae]|uniref:trypsin-like peptidase domain-containing protein n=1 Tax=Candidatus Neptunichlamydia vexilliferae TaxID=1651774 RepID=UPI0018912002|nr:trypsin-like peptidase domain-containing protein [Candidatus Neptunochlamydia vexilliferae]
MSSTISEKKSEDPRSFNTLHRAKEVKSIVEKYAPVVFRIFEGNSGKGTGFLIGPRLLMTNWHLIKSEEQSKKRSVRIFRLEEDRKGSYTILTTPPIAFDPDTVFFTSPNPSKYGVSKGKLDYTIIALKESPQYNSYLNKVQKSAISIFDYATPKQHDTAVVLGHPGIKDSITGAQGVFGYSVDAVHKLKVFAVTYLSRTSGGSSGSPVFNLNGKLIGLHYAKSSEGSGSKMHPYAGVATLMSRIIEDLKSQDGFQKKINYFAQSQKTAPLWKAPITGKRLRLPPDFSGRRAELKRLTELLKEKNKVAITGPSGIGKSSMLAKFTSGEKSIAYEGGTDNSILAGIKNLLELCGYKSDGKHRTKACDYLKEHGNNLKGYLIVFDGVNHIEGLELIYRALPANDSRFKVIVTTTLASKYVQEAHFEEMSLSSLKLNEAKDYLLSAIPFNQRKQEAEQAISLAKGLKAIPGLLKEVVIWVKKQKSSFSEYLRLHPDYQKRPKSVLASMLVGIESIKEDHSSRNILAFLAFSADVSIPRKFAVDLFKAFDPPIQEVDTVNKIGSIADQGLITIQSNYYEIHAMNKQLILEALSKEEQQNYLKNALNAFEKSFNKKNISYFSHIQKIITHPDVLGSKESHKSLLKKMADYHFENESYEEALKVADKLLEIDGRSFDSLSSLAYSLKGLERYMECIAAYKELLRNKSCSEYFKGMAYWRLAVCHAKLKLTEEAEIWFRRGIEQMTIHRGVNLTNIYLDLRGFFKELKDNVAAHRLIHEALHFLLSKNLGDYDDYARLIGRIAKDNLKDNPQKSLDNLMRVLKLSKQQKFKDSFNIKYLSVQKLYELLGVVSRKLGNNDHAIVYYKQLLKGKQQRYSDTSVLTAFPSSYIGEALSRKGDIKQAFMYHLYAFLVRKKAQPLKFPGNLNYSAKHVQKYYKDGHLSEDSYWKKKFEAVAFKGAFTQQDEQALKEVIQSIKNKPPHNLPSLDHIQDLSVDEYFFNWLTYVEKNFPKGEVRPAELKWLFKTGQFSKDRGYNLIKKWFDNGLKTNGEGLTAYDIQCLGDWKSCPYQQKANSLLKAWFEVTAPKKVDKFHVYDFERLFSDALDQWEKKREVLFDKWLKGVVPSRLSSMDINAIIALAFFVGSKKQEKYKDIIIRYIEGWVKNHGGSLSSCELGFLCESVKSSKDGKLSQLLQKITPVCPSSWSKKGSLLTGSSNHNSSSSSSSSSSNSNFINSNRKK